MLIVADNYAGEQFDAEQMYQSRTCGEGGLFSIRRTPISVPGCLLNKQKIGPCYKEITV